MPRLRTVVGLILVGGALVAAAAFVWWPTQAAEPTAWDIAVAMRACVPITSIDGTDWSVRFKLRDSRWGGGSLIPNDRFLIGNAEGYPHPSHRRVALVFPRTWRALWEGPDGADIYATRRQIIDCFNSVDLR